MVDGRQYHMNTDSRQRWMDDALRRVAAERQAVDPVTGGGWDPSVMGFDSREAMAAALAQPSVSKQRSPSGPSGFMGPLSHLLEGGQDIVNYLKNRPFASGRQVPMAGIPSVGGFGTGVPRTNLNPNAGIGDLANIGLDMAVGTLGDVGVTRDDPGHVLDKDQAIPFGRIAAAGLLPLKGIRSVAKSLIGGADEAVETGNRTRRMQEAERSVAAAGRAEREALKESGHYAELPGEARKARQTAATTEREELLDIMGEVGLEDPNSVEAILREAYGSTPPKSSLDYLEPQWADNLASAEPVAQTSKFSDLPPLPDTTASGRPILGVGPNRAPVTPKTDAAGRQIQGIFSGMSDAMGGGALADALGPASRGVSKIDDTLLPRLPGEGDEAAAKILGRDEFGSYKKPEPKLGDRDYTLKAGDPGYKPRLDPKGDISVFEYTDGKISIPKKAFSKNVDDLTTKDIQRLVVYRDDAYNQLALHSRGIERMVAKDVDEAINTIKRVEDAMYEKGYLRNTTYRNQLNPDAVILDDFAANIDDLVHLPGMKLGANTPRALPLSSVRPLVSRRNDLINILQKGSKNKTTDWPDMWYRSPSVQKTVDDIVELDEKIIKSGWYDEVERTNILEHPSTWKKMRSDGGG